MHAVGDVSSQVLRTWVTGHDAGQKGSNSRAVPDLEHNGIGTYDDTILDQIDQLMVRAACTSASTDSKFLL
jgi:mannan endo-1,4-beta-mannosidase